MLVLVLGFTMCLILMLGIAIASPANTARAEDTDLHIPVSTITATSNYKVEKTTTVAITDELVPVTDLEKRTTKRRKSRPLAERLFATQTTK